jgi:hypothetical protein
MGGFVSAIANAAKPLAEDGAEILTKALRPMEKNMAGQSAVGKSLVNVIKEDYIPTYHRFLQEKLDVNATLPKHQQLDPHEIHNQATNAARQYAFGSNDAVAVGHIRAEFTSGDPLTRLTRAQNLSDHLSMFLQDTVAKPEWTPVQGQYGKRGASSFKMNVLKSKEQSVPIDASATYTQPGKIERTLMGYANNIMAPLIALPHIGTLLNYAISTPLGDLAKGLSEVMTPGGVQQIKQTLRQSGVFANTTADAFRTVTEGEQGIIGQTFGTKTGSVFSQLTHQPGFNALRTWTVALGAAAGKHTAEDMAQLLHDSGGTNKRAIWELERMGIKSADVLKQKGQLTQDQLQKAVFHFVDNKVFLDNRLNRAYYARANVYTRMGLMFHSYVARQGQFLRDELVKMYQVGVKGGDIGLIAQTLATMGVVFPLVGHGLKYMEMAGRGQFQEIKPEANEDWKKLRGEEGVPTQVYTLLDGYAHMAAWGVASSYVRGATRTQLASALIGPIGNMGVRIGEDSAKLAFGKTHPWKPLARDVIEDSPLSYDNLGKMIVHQLLPTTKEEKSRHPSGKLKSFKRGKGLKQIH